jgi:sugar phosphate isomerase/epimerase
MKISCLPVSYYPDIMSGRMSLRSWAQEAKGLNLDAIDLSILLIGRRDSGYLRAAREEVVSAGMRVNMITTYPDFTNPDPEERRRQADQLRIDIRAAAGIGAEYVRVTAGMAHPQVAKSEGIRWAIEGITQSLQIAKEHGIRLVYENHSKPGVWEYPDFSMPTDIFLEIVTRTEGTELGVNFDTANPLVVNDNPILLLQKVLHRVLTVHAAETSTCGSLTPVVLGEGKVPFLAIFRLLKEARYSGWISIEEASRRGFDGVKTAVEYVRRTWDAA